MSPTYKKRLNYNKKFTYSKLKDEYTSGSSSKNSPLTPLFQNKGGNQLSEIGKKFIEEQSWIKKEFSEFDLEVLFSQSLFSSEFRLAKRLNNNTADLKHTFGNINHPRISRKVDSKNNSDEIKNQRKNSLNDSSIVVYIEKLITNFTKSK